ncbi:RNA-binding S4 domain-containing protein [Paraperlucidibaca sp.]|jgi:ribosome-associated heat shock protein Hsp15|uniref:RNA-binding S4 domain-containing protein n=1 Tax=Paraperlucidibaca sp. TaxID=2708021 RepID=UPI001B71235B|nr:RNA-binding protein [Paraperlucidibaca sp.]|tara:strand:+ start:1491 stop:1904 length:414 start_codon:yes stop_codon:yes gene_type:complete
MKSGSKNASDNDTRTRVDKWLWAARFYKTRSLAKDAIDSGHVHCDGQRVKVSREVFVDMTLTIRQGHDEKIIVVDALSSVRGPAPVAQLLYHETPESIAKRDDLREQRKAQNLAHPDHKPNKKERRQIHRFQRGFGE